MSLLRHPILVPALLVSLCLIVVVALIGLPLPVAVVIGVLVGTGITAMVARRAEGMLRRTIGARSAHAGEFPRLHNTVDGLCLTHGIKRPDVFVLDSPAGNALAMAGREGTSIVLTTGAADRLTLVELEALVAHLLVRCADGELRGATTTVALGRFPSVGRGLGGF